MDKEKSALFLGRFQPPHKGHEKAIGWMLKRHGKLRIAIGSSNKSNERENPLSAKERLRLLHEVVASHRGWKGRVSFSLVKDYGRHDDWMREMLRKFPPEKFEFYTNNKLVRVLFAAIGFAVHPNPEFRRFENEGRKIRELSRKGKSIAKRLPAAISKYEKKISGQIRSR